MTLPPLVVIDRVPPDYWNSGPWWEFGAAVVPLERVNGVWMMFQAVLPRGVVGSLHFYVLANPVCGNRIKKPILLIVPLAEFQSKLIQFYEQCQQSGKCGLIKFTFTPVIDGILHADLDLGVLPWDRVHLT